MSSSNGSSRTWRDLIIENDPVVSGLGKVGGRGEGEGGDDGGGGGGGGGGLSEVVRGSEVNTEGRLQSQMGGPGWSRGQGHSGQRTHRSSCAITLYVLGIILQSSQTPAWKHAYIEFSLMPRRFFTSASDEYGGEIRIRPCGSSVVQVLLYSLSIIALTHVLVRTWMR